MPGNLTCLVVRRGCRDNRIECRADNKARVSRLRPMLQSLIPILTLNNPRLSSRGVRRT